MLSLQLQQLSCQRGNQLLFKDLSAEFCAGDFVQIEGYNGIGKTSLLRIIAGLALPKTGEVRWNNVAIRQQRESYHQDLLYLGHSVGIKPELTAWENLRFYQQISNCQQGDDLLWQALEKVGLLGREDLAAFQLSAGQQKRIGLARLWLSQAKLWILDEPFNAIDKKGTHILSQLFEQHTERGGIVLLTSHQQVPSQRLQPFSLEPYKGYDFFQYN